jgi:hypothetical protein
LNNLEEETGRPALDHLLIGRHRDGVLSATT